MKLRNKKTGEIIPIENENEAGFIKLVEKSLPNGFIDWEVVEDTNVLNIPLIKDEKVRKAVRAWAEANGFSVFKVYNQHFNYVKIHGVKDRYDPNGSNIEFMETIAGAEKRAYEIDELCGSEE